MSSIPRPARIALIVVSLVSSLLVAGFALTRAVGAGKVLGGVTVADVELRGMTPIEASSALEDLEARLSGLPARFTVRGQEVGLDPTQVGFHLDIQSMVQTAMAEGRTGNLSEQFRDWVGSLFGGRPIALSAAIDPDLTRLLLEQWSMEILGEPPFEGAIAVVDGAIVPQYPRSGSEIDPAAAPELLLNQIVDPAPAPVELPVVTAVPALTDRDIDRAAAEARLWISQEITLRSGELSARFEAEDLAAALRSRIVEQSPPALELFFDPEAVGGILERFQASIEQPATDASFEIDGYDVKIIPGRRGTLIDPEQTALELARAASTSGRTGALPFREGAEPKVTTEQLEALDIRHLVASFTTYHDCCQNRVTNIHLIADKVDGAIVEPGASFDLNGFVGRRTTEAGYLEDGTIEQGEIIKTVGGGVSQFATTFYNAVFWGGYEDITHKPHSFYFTRYPEGIEATISWPAPDLEFRNDSQSAVLVRTRYTDTSITVEFYGNNDGRVLVGAHRNGNTTIDVVRDGGPNARKVSATKSDRFDPTEPTTRYRGNPEIKPGDSKRVQSPAAGWSIRVTRKIAQNGSERSQEWVVRYLAKPEIIEVNPCEVPGATTTCPTTTTTVPPPPTTTAP